MIILSQDGSISVNSNNVFSFFVNNDSSGKPCLAASRASGESGVVLGEYETIERAKKELQSLFRMIIGEEKNGQHSYQVQ